MTVRGFIEFTDATGVVWHLPFLAMGEAHQPGKAHIKAPLRHIPGPHQIGRVDLVKDDVEASDAG
jgi:hypothetical protein